MDLNKDVHELKRDFRKLHADAPIEQGDVHWIIHKGSQRDKIRPALIISKDNINTRFIEVVPMQTAKGMSVDPDIVYVNSMGQRRMINCKDAQFIGRDFIGQKVGDISHNTLVEVFKAIQACDKTILRAEGTKMFNVPKEMMEVKSWAEIKSLSEADQKAYLQMITDKTKFTNTKLIIYWNTSSANYYTLRSKLGVVSRYKKREEAKVSDVPGIDKGPEVPEAQVKETLKDEPLDVIVAIKEALKLIEETTDEVRQTTARLDSMESLQFEGFKANFTGTGSELQDRLSGLMLMLTDNKKFKIELTLTEIE